MALKEDLAALAILLSLVAYPLALILAWQFGWRPHQHSWADYFIRWPFLIAAFTISSALPPILVKEYRARGRPVQSPQRFAGSVTSGLLSGVAGIAILVATDCVWGGFGDFRRYSVHDSPFGVFAFAIGAGAALLIDIRGRGWGWAFFKGLALAVAATISAAMADLIVLNPPAVAWTTLPQQTKFVAIIAFMMGFLVGLFVPAGYRRYKTELVDRPSESNDAPRGLTFMESNTAIET